MEETKSIVKVNQQKEESLRNKIHEINNLIEEDGEIVEKHVMVKLAEFMCDKFSVDFLDTLTGVQMFEFIKERFRFIQKSFQEKVSVSVAPYSQETSENRQSSVILEFLVRDRPFVIDSLTEYLHAKKFNLSLIFHPVFALEHDASDRIIAVKKLSEETAANFTYCCCIIDDFYFPEQSSLKKDVLEILGMVCCVTDDFSPLSKAIEEYSLKEKKDESESLIESERRRLFTWFNEGNVILLGSGELAKEDITPELSWDKIRKPQGYIRCKLEMGDRQIPKEIGRLGSYFLGSSLNINVLETDEISVVHRRAKILLVFRKKKDLEGNIRVGFFYVLFTHKTLKEAAMAIPLARLKVNGILEAIAEDENIEGRKGHLQKTTHDFFNVIPKSELFRLDRTELRAMFDQYTHFGDYQETKLSIFTEPERLYARVTFCLPVHRFSPNVFDQIDRILSDRLGHGSEIKYWFNLRRNAYSHHIFFFPKDHSQLAEIDLEGLEQEVTALTVSWEDEFQAKLRTLPPAQAKVCQGRYDKVFNSFYQAVFSPVEALKDVEFIEALLREGREQVDLRSDLEKDESVIYIYTKTKYHLTEIMPFLQNLTLTVIDENTYNLAIGPHQVYVYTYYVKSLKAQEEKYGKFHEYFCDLLLAVLEERTEDDVLNGLLLTSGLNRAEINLFILYRNYYWQIGAPYLPINKSFLINESVMVALRDYFFAKFDPDRNDQPLDPKQLQEQKDLAFNAIYEVKTVAEDIIFKTIFNLMEATIRTNYFNIDALSAMAIKIESTKVERMPAPFPLYEIYVHDTHTEGIHLRGAMIARGGLRHSDRHGDFRTEVLGLMNTQMMKNVVIVPEGSKGGFITKRPASDRKALMAEVEKQYRIYINSLLSITDNIVEGNVVPPQGVVRYDGDDPYLVVAADKGTAILSDVANEISETRGFWLQDAFASGGKHGYDHKGMAITARGAWECVKLHFLEEGKDIQSTPFTVIGIGDMSGDVFGNGMLLSKFIRLKGAFNHIHIFVDLIKLIVRSFRFVRRVSERPKLPRPGNYCTGTTFT